jgi:uncharacterized repeat protein (TIGR01451 family)
VRQGLVVLTLGAGAALLPAGGTPRVAAQGTPVRWRFESVAAVTPDGNCVRGATLAGLDHDPQGRPVVLWREENACTSLPRVYWGRESSGAWDTREYVTELRYQGGGRADTSHRLYVDPVDGTPSVVFRSAGLFGELNTYRASLDPLTSSTYLENLAQPQTAAYTTYSLAAGPTGMQWATAVHYGAYGPVRVNGAPITPNVGYPVAALAVTPSGGQHVLWSTSNEVYYSRRTAPATAFTTTTITTTSSVLGGETQIRSDAAGTLHALQRGWAADHNYDTGTLIYLRSADEGATWSTPEFLDPFDAVPGNPGVHTDVTLAVDAGGVPAALYWRGRQQLWYARRDGAGGTWTRSLVTTRPTAVDLPRATGLDFDANGQPVVAFYDSPSDRVLVARPVPDGEVVAVDLALSGSVTPTAVAPGGTITYTFTVENGGPLVETGATITPRFPAGTTLRSSSLPLDANGRWTLPTITPFTSFAVTATIDVPSTPGDVVTTATVASVDPDRDASNDAVAVGARVQDGACFTAPSSVDALYRADGSTASGVAGQPAGQAVGSVAFAPGAIGDGFLLDGHSAVSAQSADDNAWYPGAGSFTVQTWVRTTMAGTGVVASRYECPTYGCGNTAWFMSLVGGLVEVFVRDNAGANVRLRGTRVVNDGAFHHLALVIDRATSELRIYVDGALDATSVFTLGSITNSNFYFTPLVIGAYETGSAAYASFFTGVVDEVSIARRAMTASEIAQLALVPSQPGCGTGPLVPGTDVAAELTATPATIISGGTITYLARLSNRGTTTPAGATAELVLPAGVTVVRAEPSGTPAGNTLALALPLRVPPPGGTSWAVVTVTAPLLPGPAAATFTVHAADDVVAANDVATASVDVTRPDCEPVPAGLVAHWRAEGTPADAVGGHDGQPVGQVAYSAQRPGAGLAFQFADGAAVEVPDHAALRPASFTFGAWSTPVFPVNGGTHPLLSQGSAFWLGEIAGGGVALTIRQAAGNVTLEGRGALQDTRHVAFAYDGSTVRLYVDGAEQDARVLTEPLVLDAGQPLLIGTAAGSWGSSPYVGEVDDITLHDRALDATAIAALAAEAPAACLANRAPVLEPIPDQSGVTLDAVSIPVTATDADGDDITFVAGGLPAGVSIDPVTGTVSGAPTAAGLFTVIVRASDGIDVTERSFTWDLLAPELADLEVTILPVEQDPASGVPVLPFTIRNLGPSAAQDVLVTGALSDGYVTFAGTVPCVADPDFQFFCTSFSLDAGASVTLEQRLSLLVPEAPRTGIATVRVQSAVRDPDALNNARSAPVTLPLYEADLQVSLAAPATYRVGAIVPFTVAVLNAGPDRSVTAMVSVTLDGVLAPGATLPANCWPAGPATDRQTYQCVVSSLPAGGQFTAVFQQRNSTPGTRENVAAIDASLWRDILQRDGHPENDSAMLATSARVNQAPEIAALADRANDLFDEASLGITATDADGDALTFTAGGLPPGLAIDPMTGAISGTVTTAGTYAVTVSASDGVDTATRGFSWVVRSTFHITLEVFAGGRVESSGVTCVGSVGGTRCDLIVEAANPPTLVAVPDDSRYFIGWQLPDGTLRVLMPSIVALSDCPGTYTVTFVARFFLARNSESGSIDVQLPSRPFVAVQGPVDDLWSGGAPVGTTIALVAQPVAGATFVGWSGACAGSQVTCSFEVTHDGVQVGARFNLPPRNGPEPRLTTPADVAIDVTVTGSDPDGDPLTAELLFGGVVETVGRVDRLGPMSFRFTPNPAYVGPAVFFYQLADGVATAETQGVYVQVTPRLTVPIVVDETISVSDEVAFTPAVRIVVDEVVRVSDTAEFVAAVSIVVDERIQVSDAVAATPPVAIVVDETILVTDTPGVTPAMALVVDEVITVSDTDAVTATTPYNTPTGTGVTVVAAGPALGTPAPQVTFASVTRAGDTTYQTVGGMSPPAGFAFGNPATVLDISTTATFAAPVTVCFTFPLAAFRNPASVRIFHYEQGAWLDRTASASLATRQVCARVSSLSPFALAEADVVYVARGDGRVLADSAAYDLRFHARSASASDARATLRIRRRGGGGREEVEFLGNSIDARSFGVMSASSAWQAPRAASWIGSGRLNGADGYSYEAQVTDAGEPGRERDSVAVTVRDAAGFVVMQVQGVSRNGNVFVTWHEVEER